MNASVPATYAIRVDGHLDDHWCRWFDGLALTRDRDGTSTLTGPIADQAQLHGTLARLRDIGATLLDLRATDCAPPPVGVEHPLYTGRLTLRPARPDDADPTWRYRQIDSVNEWLTGGPADIAGHRDLFADPTRLAATVVIQLGRDPSAAVIGDLLLRRDDARAQADGQAELECMLDPGHNGNGYATEAVRGLLRHSLGDLGVRRVTATCFLGNAAAWRLAERVGMRRETHAVRSSLHRSGVWLDTVTYALLADEWRG
ncbi:GNAT family protein [Actinoplanes sp. NPDC051633]|uniref:GNAT family N-acetyltransferase n=1 Tax=Actinoplanes sp. NPDC051633 TaxID=3155670 RepID=UPI00342E8C3D